MRLLPKGRREGWAPYVWLFYFCFFLLNPILNHTSWKGWIATALATIAFLTLYFSFFWIKCPWNQLNLLGFVLLGIGFGSFNEGACTFFVFAAAFAPYAVETEWAALKLLAVVLAVAVAECWLFHFSVFLMFRRRPSAMVLPCATLFLSRPASAHRHFR